MNASAPALVDTHAHLCSPEFEHDLIEVLGRAAAAGVRAVIAVGETLADAVRNIQLSEGQVAEAVASNTVRLYGPLAG